MTAFRQGRLPVPVAAADAPAPPDSSVEALLERAKALGIPWERLLQSEIAAETAMRAFFVFLDGRWPLWAALAALPFNPLQSWRVRDRMEVLSQQARTAGCPVAARQLRAVFRHLCGKSKGSAPAPALARHLWFAYHRVLFLQSVGRAAKRREGDLGERIAAVVARTACSRDDAEWAVRRVDRPDGSHLLDDAMRKARDEGFEIPIASTEVRAFRRLRSVARSSPHLVRRALSDEGPGDPEESKR